MQNSLILTLFTATCCHMTAVLVQSVVMAEVSWAGVRGGKGGVSILLLVWISIAGESLLLCLSRLFGVSGQEVVLFQTPTSHVSCSISTSDVVILLFLLFIKLYILNFSLQKPLQMLYVPLSHPKPDNLHLSTRRLPHLPLIQCWLSVP